jgi:hypothetical protein
MIRVRLLKRRRREVKVDPKLGGQWNVPSLVAIGRSQAWWPMEGERKTPFHLFHFPPTTFTYTFKFFFL